MGLGRHSCTSSITINGPGGLRHVRGENCSLPSVRAGVSGPALAWRYDRLVLHSNSRIAAESRGHAVRHMLLVDTCGVAGSLALARVGGVPEVIGQEVLPGRSTSERLLPAVRSLLAGAQVAPGALGAIVVVHGPGSFTGVRIGLSAVKGLAMALDIPVIAISRLAVLAGRVTAEGAILALLDAGRGEMYAGEYRGALCVREALRTRDDVLMLAHGQPARALVACEPSVAESLASVAESLASVEVAMVPELSAADALDIAVARLSGGLFDDLATLDANYVRRTDAEIFAKPKVAQGPAR